MSLIKKEEMKLESRLNDGFRVSDGYIFAEITKAETRLNRDTCKRIKKTASIKIDNVIRKQIGSKVYESDLSCTGKKETAKNRFFSKHKK